MKKGKLDLLKFEPEAFKILFAGPPLAELSFGFHFASGFILHMVSAPEIIDPSEWLPMVFKSGEMPAFQSDQQGQTIVGALLSIWQHWAEATLDSETIPLPPGCGLDGDGRPTPELLDFCNGYLMGCHWLKELWAEVFQERGNDSNEDLILSTAMMLCLLSIGKHQELIAEDPERGQRIEALPPEKALDMLPMALTDLAALGRALHMEALRSSGPVKAPPTPGRNDPCPCGSGKKYKKCCM
jgi:uncharacterized protein